MSVDGDVVSSIGPGLCLLVGVEEGDGPADVEALVDKVVGLRVFADESGRMNLSIGQVGGEIMVVSQFTLLGDVRRGRRPSFSAAGSPEQAEPLVDQMAAGFAAVGIETRTGVFGAMMKLELINDGPVTLVLDVTNATVG